MYSVQELLLCIFLHILVAERNSLGTDRIFVYRYNRLYPIFKMLYENKDPEQQVICTGTVHAHVSYHVTYVSTCIHYMCLAHVLHFDHIHATHSRWR